MTTTTDTAWEAIKDAFPANFMTNQSSSFTANQGWLDTMMNRIALTRTFPVDSFNSSPFAKYNRGLIPFGDTVQTYKTKKIDPVAYDPDDTTSPFATKKNPPIAQYNAIDSQYKYKVTINSSQIAKAFTGETQLGNFVADQLSAMAESDLTDQFTAWKKYLSDESKFTVVSSGTDIYDTIRSTVMDFRMPSKDFNKAGDLAYTSGNIDIILTKEKFMEVGNKLGGVFHPDYIALENATVRWIDDFATSTGSKAIDGLIVDERALSKWDRPPLTNGIMNPETASMNYTTIFQRVYGVDLFRNAVVLEAE